MLILITPHPFLKHRAQPLKRWDKKTAREVKEMTSLLKKASNPKGVGLSATQVGLDKRLFILYNEKENKTTIYVNPKIIKSSRKMLGSVYKTKKERWLEGCLSVPKLWGFVDRPYSIKVRYQVPTLLDDKWRLIDHEEDFRDMQSAYIQHEIDHLDGILFTDHILDQNGTIYRETENGLVPVKL